MVRRFLRPDATILDIGCSDGAMFDQLKGRYRFGYGIEPTLESEVRTEFYHLLPGTFPDALPAATEVDLITMLAVLEHLPPSEQVTLAESCCKVLRPGGRVLITVPSPQVDDILHALHRLRLIDGMSMHEHYGFEPSRTPAIFGEPQFELVEHKRFQLGLNNFFLFEKA